MSYVADGYVVPGYIADANVQHNPLIVFDNRLDDAVPVANNTLSGAAINLTDFRPYTSWTPAAFPGYVTVDCGVAASANSISVCNHNLFSKGCWIEARGSSDNFVSSDDLLASYFPTADTPFVYLFNAASYRYWRIRVMGNSLPTLSVVALGTAMEIPVGLPYGFDPLTRKVFGQTNISEQGLPLGKAVLFEQWAQTLTFRYISSAWLRATFLPAWKSALRGTPFLFAWNLTAYANEIYLVEAGDNIKTPQTLPAYSDLVFDVKGVALV